MPALETKGTIYALLSGLCYGLIGYFGVNIINSDFSVVNMLFWRFLVSSILITVILLPMIRRLNLNYIEVAKVLFFGAAFYSNSAIFYFLASKYMGTGLAMVAFFAYPAIVILLNRVFYKTKISRSYYSAVILIILGMVLLIIDEQDMFNFDILGIAFGILSATSYAFYIMSSKKNKLTPLTSTLMVSISCAFTCLVVALIDNSFALPNNLFLWKNIVGLGVICTALPILLLLEALKYITPEKASILSVLEPVFVILFGVFFLGETVNQYQALGVLVVLIGAIITLFSQDSIKKSA
jgi:drug/metabolite transporter (DMT)-like permease